MKIQNKTSASFLVILLLLVNPCYLFLDLRRPTFIKPDKKETIQNFRETEGTKKNVQEYKKFFGYTFDCVKDGSNLK